jgi:hypothetical protein
LATSRKEKNKEKKGREKEEVQPYNSVARLWAHRKDRERKKGRERRYTSDRLRTRSEGGG